MSISDGLDPNFFRRKMKRTGSIIEEMDGEVLFSRQSRHFSFIDKMIKVLLPICTLDWRVNNYVSRQGKGMNRGNESTNKISIYVCSLWYCNNFVENVTCLL